MRHPDETLGMPLYIKTDPDMEWPDHASFYMLTGSGLFLCRNHPFFRSCVPARSWPADLDVHSPSLALRYPKIPTVEFERIIGFFSRIADLHGSEAAVLLLWDAEAAALRTYVPTQSAGVSVDWTGHRYPLDVRYEQPIDLPASVTVVGDVHSHVHGAAYASSTDKHDETHRAGFHIVVGRISRDPPDLHCEVVVDGRRFDATASALIEGYEARRDDFPDDWVERVSVDVNRPYYSGGWRGGDTMNGEDPSEPQVTYEPYRKKGRKRWS